MLRQLWMAAVLGSAVAVGMAGCGQTGGGDGPPRTEVRDDPGPGTGGTAADGGATDGGTDGGGTGGGTDGGGVPDAGEPEEPVGPGPWPLDAKLNYSSRYGIGSVQSVGVDSAFNIWLLDGNRIGVLRPGDSKPTWVTGLGQAAGGFGREKLAMGSTVICGGAKNQAYVGYWTYDLEQPRRDDPDDPEFKKGDLDVVQLNEDGTITFVEHLHRSTGTSHPGEGRNMGIRNSIDWHYDEDRSVLTCQRVMRGPYRGEVYIGTNHGVTRIRGLEYNAHRHPVWDIDGTLMLGYTFGLGIAQNGDVLIANDWKVAILPPPPALGDWEFHHLAPWKLDTYNQELNSLEAFDHWRGFQQTPDGRYYLGSYEFGLWRMEETGWAGSANWFRVAGLPTESINALAATDDGSLFIGTDDQGLWRMDAAEKMEKVSGVSGSRVLQLLYDPTVESPMLYVLTDQGLTVLRGH
jgi:hypothetical protein